MAAAPATAPQDASPVLTVFAGLPIVVLLPLPPVPLDPPGPLPVPDPPPLPPDPPVPPWPLPPLPDPPSGSGSLPGFSGANAAVRVVVAEA